MVTKLKYRPTGFVSIFNRHIRMTLTLGSIPFYSFVVKQFGRELVAMDEYSQKFYSYDRRDRINS